MADALRERLQPSLLERLTDEAPGRASEGRDARLIGPTQLRASVLRNLSNLFNAVCLEADHDLDAWPEVRRSVLNFGLPALSGRVASSLQMRDLERELRQAVICFEPRLLPDSVRVSALGDNKDPNSHNVITFRIEAQLWAQPAPVPLSLHTELSLESGQCVVAEAGAGGARR
jgi:type VI secretion system protein ImpF